MDPYIIGFLGSLIVFLTLSHYHERRHLLDRLMAKNLEELSDVEAKRVKAKQPPKPVDNSMRI